MDTFIYRRAVQGIVRRQVPQNDDSQLDHLIGGLLQSGAATPSPFVRPSTKDDPDTLGQLADELGLPLDSLTNLPTQASILPPDPLTTPTDIPLTTPSSDPSSTLSQTSDNAVPTSVSSAPSSPSLSPSSTLHPSESVSATSSPTPSATSTPSPSPPSDTLATSSAGSSTPSESATAAAAASGPKSFIENKKLSIPVLTLSSIALLVLLIVLATWAIRRRHRRDSVEKIVEGISTDDLLGPTDIEKGAGLGFVSGYGGGSNSGLPVLPGGMERVGFAPSGDGVVPVRPPPTAPAMPRRHMYERPAPSVLPPSAPARGYDRLGDHFPGYGQTELQANHGMQAYAVGMHGREVVPTLDNPFDDQNGYAEPNRPYLPPVNPVSPLTEGVVSRSTSKGHRKPPPRALSVTVPTDPAPPAAHDDRSIQYASATLPAAIAATPHASPSTASPVNPALVALPSTPLHAACATPGSAEAGSAGTTHSSMLQGPVSASSAGSHVRALDPALPALPVASPLPDESGTHSPRVPPPDRKGKKKVVRQLKVVNQ